ncbi:FRG domain-containing protein [Dokdonella sp.]|uniref:FRG domain-containing protein n=1 Tax=Dokdonella sp. TaxID=2291710 RepID=UPI0037830DF1
MEEIVVASLPQYLDAVFGITPASSGAFFRGVKDADNHRLISKAGRLFLSQYQPNGWSWAKYWPNVAAKMQQFADKLASFPDHDPTDVYETWALAQHYGFPTCFMDWTLNPLVALFFAIDERGESRPLAQRGDAAVYCCDDPGIRIFRPKSSNPPDLQATDEIFCYAPRHISKRITAQAGIFTYHPKGEVEFAPKKPLTRFRIPNANRREILVELSKCGVDDHFIYQDLDGLGSTLFYVLGGLG